MEHRWLAPAEEAVVVSAACLLVCFHQNQTGGSLWTNWFPSGACGNKCNIICADVKIAVFRCCICPRRHYGEELFQGKLKWWKMCAAWSVLGFVRTPARAIILCETAGQSLWDCGWLVTVCVSLCRSLCEWEPLLLSGCYSFQWRSKSLSVDQPANQACIILTKETLALHKRTRMLKEKEAALGHIQENLLRKLSDLLARRGWSVGVLVIWCNAGAFLSHPC